MGDKLDMFCKNCGAQLADGEKFCGKCGTLQDEVTQTVTSNPVPNPSSQESGQKADAEKPSKDDDDILGWAEIIKYVYGGIFGIILIILGIVYWGAIASAWRIADSKIAFIIHSLDYLCTLYVWDIPLCVIEAIYLAVKIKFRQALYYLILIPCCIIVSMIASAVFGSVGGEIVFLIALMITGGACYIMKGLFYYN